MAMIAHKTRGSLWPSAIDQFEDSSVTAGARVLLCDGGHWKFQELSSLRLARAFERLIGEDRGRGGTQLRCLLLSESADDNGPLYRDWSAGIEHPTKFCSGKGAQMAIAPPVLTAMRCKSKLCGASKWSMSVGQAAMRSRARRAREQGSSATT